MDFQYWNFTGFILYLIVLQGDTRSPIEIIKEHYNLFLMFEIPFESDPFLFISLNMTVIIYEIYLNQPFWNLQFMI